MIRVWEPTVDGEMIEIAAHWLLAAHRDGGEWFGVDEQSAVSAVKQAFERVARGELPAVRLAKGGRPVIFPDVTPLTVPAGTLARIDAACSDKEKRSDFIREAVERELKRRGK